VVQGDILCRTEERVQGDHGSYRVSTLAMRASGPASDFRGRCTAFALDSGEGGWIRKTLKHRDRDRAPFPWASGRGSSTSASLGPSRRKESLSRKATGSQFVPGRWRRTATGYVGSSTGP
jgi:hypothetical protein